jgi:uncharacterized phiE125 gp8 family phage protein
MSLQLIADAATEPVSLAEARQHLRISDDYTGDDADISSMIVAYRKQAEHATGRALATQTWELVLDAFPEAEIELGVPFVIDVTSITYIDPTGVEQSLAASEYVLDRETEPGYVLPVENTEWPENYPDTINAVRVQFTAGRIPDPKWLEPARRWILARVKCDYDGTEPLPHFDRMLDIYRTYL